jgi:hypothetical protein
VSYRPICDVWILARPKVKYYGAYPNGFLERGRRMLPARRATPVLHVCGGKVKEYPTWSTLCPNDVTCDLDPDVTPDVVWNVRTNGIPDPSQFPALRAGELCRRVGESGWRGMLIDRPYTPPDADHYAPGSAELPEANQLLRDAMDVLVEGGRVGILDYVWPQPPRIGVRSIACIGVIAGFNNRMRCFSVFEKQ